MPLAQAHLFMPSFHLRISFVILCFLWRMRLLLPVNIPLPASLPRPLGCLDVSPPDCAINAWRGCRVIQRWHLLKTSLPAKWAIDPASGVQLNYGGALKGLSRMLLLRLLQNWEALERTFWLETFPHAQIELERFSWNFCTNSAILPPLIKQFRKEGSSSESSIDFVSSQENLA